MKYYIMCKKMLGPHQFNQLIENLTEELMKKHTDAMLINDYLKYIEENLKVIVLLAMCEILDIKDQEKEEKIYAVAMQNLLIGTDFNDFKKINKFYIEKIVELML